MNRRQLLADISLLSVTAIWGGTFVMVKEAVSAFPVFAFLFIRFTLATLSLLPLRPWLERNVSVFRAPGAHRGRRGLLAGAVLGLVLTAGYGFQTFGLQYTTPAKAGFITGLSVVIVPTLAAIVMRRPPERSVWVGVLLATAGLALLSLNRDLRPQFGDVLVFFCAISFALHILITGYLAPGHAPLDLTLGQLATTALLSGLISFLWERPWPAPNAQMLFAALFTGLLASTFAFTVQTLAQRFTTASHTALIFSTEPVFAALFSFLLGVEPLTVRVLVGGGLILAGMAVAELGPIMWARARPELEGARAEQGSGG